MTFELIMTYPAFSGYQILLINLVYKLIYKRCCVELRNS